MDEGKRCAVIDAMEQDSPVRNPSSVSAKIPRPAVDAILPLSSLQTALWVRGRQGGSDDPGRVLLRVELRGALDPKVLGRAWQLTIDGFEALRTTVNTDARGEPLLVCRRNVTAAIAEEDWRALGAAETGRRLEETIAAERLAPLPLSRAPSSRLRCIRLDTDRSVLLWSCHHLLLDGWSSAVVVNALLANYLVAAGLAAAPVTEALPYSAYRRALKARDDGRGRAFWRALLRGHEHALRLGGARGAAVEGERATRETTLLDAREGEVLRQACRDAAITPGTAVQAAWALLLGALCGREDVVIALATAGRPSELAGIGSTAGFLSNVVPLRVALDAERRAMPVSEWLRELQGLQFAAREHEHIPYAEIVAEAEVPFARDGVDSLLVIENLPTIATAPGHPLAPIGYRSDLVSGFPLTVTVLPLESWTLRIDFDTTSFDAGWIERLGTAFGATLRALAGAGERGLDELRDAALASLPAPAERARRDEGGRGGIVLRDEVLDALAPPDNLAELTMLALWEDLLQRKPLSMDASFFDVGGGSLLALRLIAAVETEFGRRVPIQRFIEAPTPRAMLRAVEDEGAEHEPIPSLVTLRAPPDEGAREPALFCLHAGGGHALFYRDFARRLGGGRAVYALQPKGIDGLEEPLDTIEAMAEHYIGEIVAAQPWGPYHLLCYCFGGGLVLEMARRLHAAGHEVGHLVVVDAPSPIPARHPMARLGWRAYLACELLAQGRWRDALDGVRKAVRARRHRARRARESEREGTEALSRPNRVQHACKRAFERYRAEPSAFELHIVHGGALAPEHGQDHYMRGWRTLAPRRRVLHLDDAHDELFLEPGVRRTGACVTALLGTPSPNASPSVRRP